MRFQLEFEAPAGTFHYELLIGFDRERLEPRVAAESLRLASRSIFELAFGDVTLVTSDGPLGYSIDEGRSYLGIVGSKVANGTLRGFPSLMAALRVFKLEPSAMGALATAEEPTLSGNGSNFASWFSWFARNRLELVPSFFELVRGPLPSFVSIKAVDHGEATRLVVRLKTRAGEREFSFAELSDGQRQLICLYLIVLSIEPGQVLFFDEPDNFLSIREVQPWLGKLEQVAEEKGAQVFIASHGTEAMNYLGSRQAWVVSRKGNGGTTIEPLHEDSLPSEHLLYGGTQEQPGT
jgi:hypothetical protein